MTISIGKNTSKDENVLIGKKSMRPVEHEHLQIGDNAIFNSGTVIYLGSKIGNGFKTGHNVVIREEVLIGDNVSVWGNSTVDYGVILGNNVKVHTSCYIAQYTHIENDVFLAPGVIIGNDIHPGCAFSHECMKRFAVRIKRGAQIGLNVTILPGVVIGEGAVVGAGTVVTKDVPDHSVVVGNPARVIKKTSEVVCLLPERKGYCPYK